jgi:hypothetical protein
MFSLPRFTRPLFAVYGIELDPPRGDYQPIKEVARTVHARDTNDAKAKVRRTGSPYRPLLIERVVQLG